MIMPYCLESYFRDAFHLQYMHSDLHVATFRLSLADISPAYSADADLPCRQIACRHAADAGITLCHIGCERFASAGIFA